MKFLILVSLVLVCLGTVVPGENSSTKNSYVKCDVSVKQKKLKPGGDGELLITLIPKQGIHVNLDPPLNVKLDSSEAVSSVGKVLIPQKDTVLDTSKPIRLPFTLSKKVKPINVTIRGTVTYFYCSESDGWCSKFKQPIEVKFTVIK